MKWLFPFLFFTLFLSPRLVTAQPPQLVFQTLNANQGLSQSFVTCLAQEANGIVWAGTQNGLNRFDGYRFRSDFHQADQANSLSNNYIWTLAFSDSLNLWIGTNGGGLCHYDIASEQYTTYFPQADFTLADGQNRIRAIASISPDQLLVGTDRGLFLFNTNQKTFTPLPTGTKEAPYHGPIFSFHALSDQQYLIGGLEQLFIWEGAQVVRTINLPQAIDGGIHAFAQNGSEELWLGTGKGLFQMRWQNTNNSLELLRHFQQNSNDSTALQSNAISSLWLDAAEGLWLGTDLGLHYLSLQNISEGFRFFQNQTDQTTSISSNQIFDLLEVEPGIVWAATQQGINQFSIKSSSFQFKALGQKIGPLCGNSAHGMAEDQKGNLWLCTEKGLLQIPAEGMENAVPHCWTPQEIPEMADEFLVSISPGESDNFWVALRRGGYAEWRVGKQGLEWQAARLPAGAYQNIGTNDLWEEEGQLWIASSGLGLWQRDLQTGVHRNFRHAPEDSSGLTGNYIFQLFPDSKGFLWIATADGGLCKMDRDREHCDCFTHDLSQPQSISSNMVLSVFEDPEGRIWASTANGLNLLEADGKFRRFYQKDGLPNDVVYGVLADEEGHLWISTDGGLARLQSSKGEWEIRSFDRSNGLVNNEFNQHAFYRRRDGTLVFGTRGGLQFFQAKDIGRYQRTPRIVLNDFQLFNRSVEIGKSEGSIFRLPQSIQHIRSLSLRHDQNFISFGFTGINFEQGQANQYAYQLEGLDQGWVFADTRRRADYPGLQAGRYRFKVKAANHDGQWTKIPHELEIYIKTPPWKSWWAYLLYGLGIFTLLYALFRYRLHTLQQIEATKQAERLRFRRRSAQDFHDEAGNQITKISLMTEMAQRQATEQSELKGLLEQIADDVQTLRMGMRDFIWVLDPDKDNLYETLLRLKEWANGVFEYSDIHFSTTGIGENLAQVALKGPQRRHLLLLFKEAINNSLKYSAAGEAQLQVTLQAAKLKISYRDNGRGFEATAVAQGYGLKNMQHRAKKLGWQYQLQAAPGQGTYIEVIGEITQMGN